MIGTERPDLGGECVRRPAFPSRLSPPSSSRPHRCQGTSVPSGVAQCQAQIRYSRMGVQVDRAADDRGETGRVVVRMAVTPPRSHTQIVRL